MWMSSGLRARRPRHPFCSPDLSGTPRPHIRKLEQRLLYTRGGAEQARVFAHLFTGLAELGWGHQHPASQHIRARAVLYLVSKSGPCGVCPLHSGPWASTSKFELSRFDTERHPALPVVDSRSSAPLHGLPRAPRVPSQAEPPHMHPTRRSLTARLCRARSSQACGCRTAQRCCSST